MITMQSFTQIEGMDCISIDLISVNVTMKRLGYSNMRYPSLEYALIEHHHLEVLNQRHKRFPCLSNN